MVDVILASILNNEFIDKNENTLYISEEENRICKYKENTKSFVDIVPIAETILLNGNSSINGRIEIPMKYNGVYSRKLIVQWGRTDVAIGDNTINFNTQFPNAIYNVQATPNNSNINVGIDKIDNTTCKINSSGIGRVFWIAIGQ